MGDPHQPRRDQVGRPAGRHPGGDGEADARRARPPRRDPHRRGHQAVRRSSPPRARSRRAVLKAEGASARRRSCAPRARPRRSTPCSRRSTPASRTSKLLSYQYLQMLPQLAQGEANKVFVIPSEFTQALGHIATRSRRTAPSRERRAGPHAPDSAVTGGAAAAAAPPSRRPHAGGAGRAVATVRRAPARVAARARAAPSTRAAPDDPREHSAGAARGRGSLEPRVYVRRPLREAPGDARRRPRARHADRGRHQRARCARSASRCSRPTSTSRSSRSSRRGQGALPGRRRDRAAQPRPAGRQDRQRGARRADGRRVARRSTFSPRPPTVILMAGLQGSGKTTATAKLARCLRERARLARSRSPPATSTAPPPSTSSSRSAAQVGATVYEQGTDRDPVDIAAWALDAGQARRQGRPDRRHRRPPARRRGADGRARRRSARRSSRTTVLLVVDAMTGQDAVNVAEQFAEAVAVRRRRA